jgi:predicted ATPase
MGYSTVGESARAIIAERLAQGKSPRPEPLAFAQEILRRDAEKYAEHPRGSRWVFFDRGAVESLAMVHAASPIPSAELQGLLNAYRFHNQVFVLPPWEAIYVTDSERDHSFSHAVRVHAEVVRWYDTSGYSLHEVPRRPVPERARQVGRGLGERGA